jgi:hypothetical protein
MEPVKVPQHLELEDVLAWGLGATDLLHLVVGGFVAWWLYLALPLPFAVRLVLAGLVALGACSLALARLSDQPIRAWLLILIAYLSRPRLRLYGGKS